MNRNGDHFFGTAIFGHEATIKIGVSELHVGNATKIGISRGEVPSEHFSGNSILYRANGRGGLGRKLLLTPSGNSAEPLKSRPWVL